MREADFSGLGTAPPPIMAAAGCWCGARNGGTETRPDRAPAAPRDGVDARDLERLAPVGGADQAASRRPSIVFPVPERACEQQVVGSRRRQLGRPPASFWPRTSARSGRGGNGRESVPRQGGRDRPDRGDGGQPPPGGAHRPPRLPPARPCATSRWRRARAGSPSARHPPRRRSSRRPDALVRRARARRWTRAPRAGRRDRPEAARSSGRITRWKPVPSLRSAAGARLTVIAWRGHSRSAECTPLRTRS